MSCVAAFGPVDQERWERTVRQVRWTPEGPRQWAAADGIGRLATGGRDTDDNFSASRGGASSPVVVGWGRLDSPKGPLAQVVAEAWRHEGTAGLARLRGDYVFALYDPSKTVMLAGCSALGLRAPAYVWDGTVLVVASSARALSGRGGPDWDNVYLAHCLGGTWAHAEDATAFQGIRRLAGGQLLCVSKRGLEFLAGDRLTLEEPEPCDPLKLQTLGRGLDSAVKNSLRSGARRCVAVSGGIDSCVVAATLLRYEQPIEGIALVAGGPGAGSEGHRLSDLERALPGLHIERLPVANDAPNLFAGIPVGDDLVAAPAMEPARARLLEHARERGFDDVFDGEGGDELFDLACQPMDLVEERAWIGMLHMALGRGRRRELATALVKPVPGSQGLRLHALRKHARRQRPWLTEAFWRGSAFGTASIQLAGYLDLPRRRRLPGLVCAHARDWRVHEPAREAKGLRSCSPLFQRDLVERVGSWPARSMLHSRYRKPMLRRLAAQLVPRFDPWRRKSEPLHEQLVRQLAGKELALRLALERARQNAAFREWVDPTAVTLASRRCRAGGSVVEAASLVELFALLEWCARVAAEG